MDGSHINIPGVEMIPVEAFRVEPSGKTGYLTVDGEVIPWGPLQAQVLPSKGRIITRWIAWRHSNLSCVRVIPYFWLEQSLWVLFYHFGLFFYLLFSCIIIRWIFLHYSNLSCVHVIPYFWCKQSPWVLFLSFKFILFFFFLYAFFILLLSLMF